MTKTPDNPRTQSDLDAAVAAVMSQVGAVLATGQNDHAGFRYASDVDLTRAVQPAMAEHGLTLIPTDVRVTMSDHGRTKRGADQTRADVLVSYTLGHVSGQTRTVMSAGCGVDTGDKGLYKALTGALKYAIRALFLIPTPKTEADLDPDMTTPAESRRGGWSDDSGRSAPAPRRGRSSAPAPAPRSSGPAVKVEKDDRGPFSNGCPSNLDKCPACDGAVWDNRRDKKSDGAPDFRCKRRKECKWRGWLPKPGDRSTPPEDRTQDRGDVDTGWEAFAAQVSDMGWDPDAVADWTRDQDWGNPADWSGRNVTRFLGKLRDGSLSPMPPPDCRAGEPGSDFADEDIPF